MDNSGKTNDESLRIAGMPWKFYLFGGIILTICTAKNILPNNLLVGWAYASYLGFFLKWVGGRTKFLRTIGASALFEMLIPAILVVLGVIPTSVVKILKNFFGGYNFVDLFVAALMTGSILGIDEKLLKKAIVRYMIPLCAALAAALVVAGGLGIVSGYGLKEAILNIALPICGSGTGAGAVPMASIYQTTLGGASADYMTAMVPAVTVANLLCIFIACAYNAIGKTPDKPFKGFSGHGSLMRTSQDLVVDEEKKPIASYERMTVGLMISAAFYLFGVMISKLFFPLIHPYAWTCIALVVFKLSGKCPAYIGECSSSWYGFIGPYGTPPLLVAIGVTLINIQQLLFVLSNPMYFFIILAIVVVIALVSGGIGYLLDMYFLEASLTAGLCMANSGGAGDVAVLGAADRMNLMPFAAISSRIGGSLVLILASFLSRALT